MKLVVLYLLAVCCYSFASTSTNDNQQKRKLEEVLRQFNDFRQNNLQSTELMISTPQDFVGCCSLTAFKCFRDNLNVYFKTQERSRKLHRSLLRYLTESAMDFCGSETEKQSVTCTDCVSYPQQNAEEFLDKMKSLIQHAITRQAN